MLLYRLEMGSGYPDRRDLPAQRSLSHGACVAVPDPVRDTGDGGGSVLERVCQYLSDGVLIIKMGQYIKWSKK